MQYIFFISVMLSALAVLCSVLIWGVSGMALRPPRMDDARATWRLKRLSPGDLQLPFEEISFQIRDVQTSRSLRIAGWWIPAKNPSDRCVTLLHGFSDAKVGAIAWAPLWHSMGYHILAIDLRAHGESDGQYSTAGFFERHDIDQILNEIRAARPEQTREVVLFGISLGAAVASCIAGMRSDLAAVILESPYGTFPGAAAMHGRFMNVPAQFFQHIALRLAQWRAGIDYSEVSPLQTIPLVKCPMLVIQGKNDPLISESEMQSVAAAVSAYSDAEYWSLPEVGHVLGMVADPIEYREKIQSFLDRARSERP